MTAPYATYGGEDLTRRVVRLEADVAELRTLVSELAAALPRGFRMRRAGFAQAIAHGDEGAEE